MSIKIRIGWDDSHKNALEVAQIAQEAGVAWVAIHGRTRAQGYAGQADWDFIGTVKSRVSIPIVGNGDLLTPEMALEYHRIYGVDAVMVGRAALRNPFFFQQSAHLWQWRGQRHGSPLSPSTPAHYVDFMEELRQCLDMAFAPQTAFLHARKFLTWYATGFPGCHDYRRWAFAQQDPAAFWEKSQAFFSHSTKTRDWDFLQKPFLMGGHG